jgi:predicted ATPase/class 3 adenylate cyclase
MRTDLPRGTLTLLFSDIEGSTRLLESLGTERFAQALAEHRAVLRRAFAAHGGVEVDTQGDSFFVVFATARDALDAAREAQQALATGPLRVRMGVHTGTPEPTDEGYVGPDVHRAARIADAGHGGQVLVSATTAALVEDTDLRDLGVYRLRDLPSPERVFQLGQADFSPLRTAYQVNLPAPPTTFIGRERETAEVAALLERGDVRLLTLTGAGGTGKTRLALAAAARVAANYQDGVWWVSLAALRDPALVVESAGRVLGASGDLGKRIGDKRLLIVFDNFEQVAGAAPDVATLVATCPGLDMLVTSRAPLHVRAEHEYPVPPLASAEAIALFVARAEAAGVAISAADPVVAEVCRRLDDLPLAIELAAARTKIMTLGQLLGRLDERLTLLTSGPRDLPARQQTLRATIEWSYDLLAPPARELFTRLAVFRGGCDLDAAQAVAGATLDSLGGLVEQSLLRRRRDRFVMLETIREFAAERLDATPSADDVGRAHAAYYLALAEDAEPHLFSFSLEWLDRLSEEHDNLRAALDRFEAPGEYEEALRLAGALQRFWVVRGHVAEGRRRLGRLLALDGRPSAARGKALNGAAVLAINTGEPETAQRLAEEALTLHEHLADPWGAARSAFVLGYAHADKGDFATALELFERSRDGFKALGDEHNVLFVTSNLSWAHHELGHVERARQLDEENLRRARDLGNESMVALSLAALAMAALDDGSGEDAVAMMRDVLEIDRRLGDKRRTVDDLCRMSRVRAMTGEPRLAARLLAGAVSLHAEIGASVSPEIERLNNETLVLVRERIGQDALDEATATAPVMTFDEAYSVALEMPGAKQ